MKWWKPWLGLRANIPEDDATMFITFEISSTLASCPDLQLTPAATLCIGAQHLTRAASHDDTISR